MKPNFRETKATQLAGVLLALSGGSMYYLKLMKLMYLIDREGLLRWGRSITNDEYVSMDNGPVLSQTLDLIKHKNFGASYWKHFISAPQHKQVGLITEPEADELSRAEVNLIREQYAKFQKMFGHLGQEDRWALAAYTHNLPEWTHPEGSSIPIAYKDVLKHEGKSDEEIKEILSDLEEVASFESLITA